MSDSAEEIVVLELGGVDISEWVVSVSVDGEDPVPVYSPVREAQQALPPPTPRSSREDTDE